MLLDSKESKQKANKKQKTTIQTYKDQENQ